ncbi:hypothetical protein ACHAXA_009859 [Cyclostephanos tholiformis]|jgi:hypothetical protein|uniref:Uncharacterized protein n=1 Tax=Cyclostephanos tholiformis TaxID=382380 RepID=A0ABD3R6B0_9STRA
MRRHSAIKVKFLSPPNRFANDIEKDDEIIRKKRWGVQSSSLVTFHSMSSAAILGSLALSILMTICFSWHMRRRGYIDSGIETENDGPPRDLFVRGKRDAYTPCPPEARRRAWLGELTQSHVPRAFRYSGWEILTDKTEMKSGNYQILWKRKAGSGGSSFAIGKPWQRFSRTPMTRVFESKDGFLAGFRRMQSQYDQKMLNREIEQNLTQRSSHGGDLMYFIPETYRLGEESDRNLFQSTILKDKADGHNRPWFMKKVSVNNGRGIEVLPPDSSALWTAVARSEGDKENDYVVQSYICNELTWANGAKFDLRFYWLVASVDPLIVLYHDGYVRVGGAAYNESNWDTTGQHLTNHEYRVYRGKEDEDILADALWRRVRQHYVANRQRLSETFKIVDPVKHVRNQMKEAIGATAEAFKETLTLVDPNTPPVTTENLFALYGADFIVDEDLDVFYVEAQSVPGGLTDTYDYRVELWRSLLRPMINIVEEIAIKQENDGRANLLPLESLEDYIIVYAGNWRYRYQGYKRSTNKKGCKQ